MMKEITTALLSGQRKTTLQGIEIELNPPLKHDTRKNKEKEARQRAKAIVKILN